MRFSRAQLKEEVKGDIRKTRPGAVWVTLVYLLVTGLLTFLLQFLEQGIIPADLLNRFMELGQMAEYGMVTEEQLLKAVEELGGSVGAVAGFGSLLGLVSSVVTWTLTYGYRGYCLGMVRGENPGFERLLCAFPQWGWVLLTGLLTGLFTALWTLLFTLLAVAAIVGVTVVLSILVGESAMPFAVLLAVVVSLALLCGIIAVSLRYAMSNYILLDERTDALEAISRSKAMMRGRKWHLFVLYMSFLGWYLLVGIIGGLAGGVAGAFSAGVSHSNDPAQMLMGLSAASGIISLITWVLTLPLLAWLNPYATGSEAKFYDWLKHADIVSGVWESDRQYRAPYTQRRQRRERPAPSLDPGPVDNAWRGDDINDNDKDKENPYG